MKAADVLSGRCYLARVSGRLVEVRLLRTRRVLKLNRIRNGRSKDKYWQAAYHHKIVYDVVNLATGRHLTFRSGARLMPLPEEMQA